MRRHLGFTLAEVLITLGIIGVVAAMTIPTLMVNTGKSEFKTGFKKILSTMNQAVTMSVALDYMDFSDTTQTGTGTGSMYKIFADRMHIIKTQTDNTGDYAKMFQGGTGNYTLYFSDGMVLSYPTTSTKCNLGARCTGIVDVNGTKNPNRLSNCHWDPTQGQPDQTASQSDATASGSVGCVDGTNAYLADQYSVMFFGQQIIPNGYAARFILYEN